LPGFWRHEDIFVNCDEGYKDLLKPDLSEQRCCPLVDGNVSKCTSNSTDQCEEGYTGTLCMTCTTGYVRTGFECIPCEGGPDEAGAIHAIAGLCSVLFVVFSILFMKAKDEEKEDDKAGDDKKKKNNKKGKGKDKEVGGKKQQGKGKEKEKLTSAQKNRKRRQSDAGSRLMGDQIMIQRISGGTGTSSSDSSGLYKNDVQLLQDRFKVVFGWMQIFGSLCVTYEEVPWPPMFKSFSVNVGVVVNFGKCCCVVVFVVSK
jgi:hypothetical protein